MKIWYRVVVLVVVAIVSLYASWFYLHPFFALKYGLVDGGTLSVDVDIDNIFKDVLNTTLTFLGIAIALLSVAMYGLVSVALDKRIKKKINEEVNLSAANFYMELSSIYWGVYEVMGKLQGDKTSDLEIAIRQSQYALKKTNFLDKRKHEKIICWAKNNLAYHFAVRQNGDDAKSAISLATYAYERAWKYNYKVSWNWVETYAFALIRLGKPQQTKEGRKIISNILKRKNLPTSIKEYIEQKYSGADLNLGDSWT